MRSIFAPLILATCHLSAGLKKTAPGIPSEERSSLDTRQYLGGNCSSTETCSECYGPGNVICSYVACFDPSTYEQCCADASFCVAVNNSCCGSIGPGVTGVDGVPAITANLPQESSSTWQCTEDETGEECCQGGGSYLHWCSGSFPDQICYNSNSQICCNNGVVCEGTNCCTLVSAVPTTLYTSQTPLPSSMTSSPSITNLGTTKTAQSGTSRSATATSTVSPNIGPSAVAVVDAIGCGFAAAAGLIAIIIL